MKNVFKYFFIVLVFVSISTVAKSQIIDVCGTDTITLRAGNYQYGIMRWEKSFDMITWNAIPNSGDTVYKFFPTESMYYRAAVKFSECDPEFSEVSYVQMPPVANAGMDRVVPGNEVMLFANQELGALGQWSFINGTGGVLSDVNEADAALQGADTLYTLVWTLTNVCGVSSDTVEVRFRNNVFSPNLSVVDTTDVILSDSSDMANGTYVIEFSTPVPVITDSTILVGMSNGGFLRKVDSFTVIGSTYTMQTSQATLEDITESGAYDFAQVFSIDTTYDASSKKSHSYIKLDRMPTREELKTHPMFQSGKKYYYLIHEESYLHPGVTVNTSPSKGNAPLINLNFNFAPLIDTNGVKLELNGTYKYTPNFVADLDYNYWGLKHFKLGSSNATEEKKLKLTLTVTSGLTLPETKFEKWKVTKYYLIIIGSVPVLLDVEFKVEGELKAEMSTTLTAAHEVTEKNVTNAYIEYSNSSWDYTYNKTSQASIDNSLTYVGEIKQSFEIGPVLSFKIYNVLGPYIDFKLKEELKLCANLEDDWQASLDLGSELKLGAKATILGKDLIDVSKSWNYGFFNYRYPDSLEIWSGNNQMYFLGDTLANDVKVKVHSSRGVPLPYGRVRFTPKCGGFVQDSIVFTNILGYAQTKWVPGDTLLSKLEVSVLTCDSSHIKNSPLTFIARVDTNVCAQSSLSAAIVNIDENTVSVEAQMGIQPFMYSTDGVNFVPLAPEIITVPGTTYTFTVKDDEGCLASVSYYAEDPCDISGLSVDIWVLGDSIIAQGTGGTPPYLYAINDTFSFSSNYIFENMPIGTHYVYVKDAVGCVRGAYANVLDFCTASGLAVYVQVFGDSVVAEASGGTPPYLFAINDTTGFSVVNSFPNMPVGTHTVYVKDAANCVKARYAIVDNITVVCDPFTDIRDGKTYQVVIIGNKCWMADNLYYQTGNSWCYNDYASCNNFGYLYDYYTAINACPAGWSLPTDADWAQMIDTLGGDLVAGGKLKDTNLWTSPNTGATNQVGFSARPGGSRASNGYYQLLWDKGYWWTSTPDQPSTAYNYRMEYNNAEVKRAAGNMTLGFSVRCVKD